VKRIGLFGKFSRPRVAAIIESRAADLGMRYRVAKFDLDKPVPRKAVLDLAVVFGGDGTILQAARYLAPLGVPAIGVNLGKFGFLAGCVEADCPVLVEAALSGRIKAVVRSMLSGRAAGAGKKAVELVALNDIVVTASVPAQMIGVELSINGGPVSSFQGDGLIIASPTGSTGYNLSSGGPIVAPDEEVIILTPLAAHTLAIRPMVISSSDVVDVRVSARHGGVCVTADGQVPVRIGSGSAVRVRQAPYKFRLFEGPGWSFYRVVRDKLRWGEEPNYAKDSN